ncbi:hypothetical protein LZ30DRAFT_178517 [Colletotrichum cereale]|nr:hypothetical protein LZ30DRAFT_178517 [Colletotrichum cereale]
MRGQTIVLASRDGLLPPTSEDIFPTTRVGAEPPMSQSWHATHKGRRVKRRGKKQRKKNPRGRISEPRALCSAGCRVIQPAYPPWQDAACVSSKYIRFHFLKSPRPCPPVLVVRARVGGGFPPSSDKQRLIFPSPALLGFVGAWSGCRIPARVSSHQWPHPVRNTATGSQDGSRTGVIGRGPPPLPTGRLCILFTSG